MKTRTQAAAEMDRLATETGDLRFRVAAGVLRGGKAGRPTIDDADALTLMQALIEEGAAKSIREAAKTSARLHYPLDAKRAANRLRTKYGR